ncbi:MULTISPECIES: phosphate signaling complex protein PhoU [Photobacterium]|jgi:phosphate transport system protein|uniref:Phosphate-specific transport system accessory protein PhoU n=3 Tax=Photobacterium TaxID=657 RepID=A0A1T5I4K8_9GAMM|nr:MULTISPECIES: phosphate signaling complex protein PhoU [Photobacterium]KAE8175799.1 phosphate transport system regulatory protein PhoU [Photobacterium carnosum]KJG12513.1 transcriptional regulator PhoU [Photobacterium iliopiscarium]KJG22168.1 transcriptional regulator PhoU [Photobacterium iliopiscarium]MBY3789657.1 phosphate signaling complex protein PhoU [Photobacterium carnosum]MCD9467555.1 phosphate transport system regulatory protein PhoU [Photobacterium iliopiscarium]
MLNTISLGRHISGQFNHELESIRTHVLAMGGLVEQQLADSLKALHKQNEELAKRVIRDDHKVNAMEVAIDEACTRIIAKRQPTASDLRLVIAIIKTITDLERIGDVAESIAKVASENFTNKQYNLLVSLESLGQHAVRMLHETLDAFARMDVKAAIEVYQEDDRIDREYEAIIRQLMTYMMEDPNSIPNVMKVMWAARSIERVGDRCQNICEYIIYFVQGKDIRHTNPEDIKNML